MKQNPASPIDGIYLYQLAVIDQPNDTSVMGHALCISETQHFSDWRAAGKPRRGFHLNLAVGAGTQSSRLQLTNGAMRASFTDGYLHQRGEFYTVYPHDPNKPTNAWIRNLASGIFQHAVLTSADGSELVLQGRFPPTKEITLFD